MSTPEILPLTTFAACSLAERVGVTRQTILSIEKGKYSPSVGLALTLSSALGAPVETLFQLNEAETHD